MAVQRGVDKTIENLEELAIQGQALYNIWDALEKSLTGVPKQLTDAVDRANTLRVSFQQSFGIFDAEKGSALLKNLSEFNNGIRNLEISTANLAKNFQELGKNLNSFVYAGSEQTLMSFSKMVSLNEKFGISSNTSIAALNTMTTQFGMNAKSAGEFNSKLLEFADKTGQPFNLVFEKFNGSIKEFYTVLDPTKATSQFTAFQQLARGLGGEISEFMGVAKQFNTLEGASQFGANLNNVLSVVGGSFDAMQASMMSYDERIKYIVKSVADSREQIMQMDDISRQAYIQQLQQTTTLRGETIQAILNNQQLVDSVEELTTGKQFDQMQGISDKRLEQMAQNFTKFGDRSNLFMDQYTRLGVRLERYVDVQTKKVRDIQFKVFGGANELVESSRTPAQLVKNITEAFKRTSIADLKKDFKSYMDESVKDTKKAIEAVLAPAGGAVLETKIPGVISSPSGARTIGQLEENVNLTESIQKGITNGIAEATSKIQAKEMKITIHATPLLKAYLSATVEEKKPYAALLGGTAGKTGGK
jgi:hypothetical protein